MNDSPSYFCRDLTARRSWAAEGTVVLTASVRLPEPEGLTPALRRLRRFYLLQCRCFLRYCQRFLLPEAAGRYQTARAVSTPFRPMEASLDYHITLHRETCLSLYTEARAIIGIGFVRCSRYADTWDLSSGCPIPLSALFPTGTPWRQELLRRALEEARRQERCALAVWDPELRRNLRRSFSPRRFYLTEEGLTWFYPLGALGPAKLGLPAFSLPWGELGLALPEPEA